MACPARECSLRRTPAPYVRTPVTIASSSEVNAKMMAGNEGQPTNAAAGTAADKNGFSLISSEKLIALYAAMLQCRMIAERSAAWMEQGRIACGLQSVLGHEAAIAAVAADLIPDDTLSHSHLDLLAAFLRGQPLASLLASLAAPANGHAQKPISHAGNGAAHLLKSACDAALAHKTSSTGKVAVAFLSGSEIPFEGWRETLPVAGRHELPVLFVWLNTEDDKPESPAAEARFEAVAEEALTHGVPAIAVEINDVVAVYRVASESIARARLGRGPTLIECRPHQLPHHGGAHHKMSDPLDAHDPIRNMEKYLAAKQLFSAKLKPSIISAFALELDQAAG
jgi:TPP-dependent pyruvate/acetoin dehydrogenase alpha subunit